ncbi:hydroxymethylglutaryl-CoA synthase, partial [archaeon]
MSSFDSQAEQVASIGHSNAQSMSHSNCASEPVDNYVGILGMEVYFPSTYVTQADLEKANNVSAGKYTIGLGQEIMAFTGDHEDINSIALTVVHSLLEKYNIDPRDVGRLEVGTETLVDKSKSTKTVLMSLFAPSGNTDIEGATVVNACYGGTAALLNALTWVDSSSWDGRYAIVVCGDIAVYADGPARPTGGCGSVAMLIGRNAPISIDLRTRTCSASHVWDFFKPNLHSEYPTVNGALSQTCYLQSLDDCYTRFLEKSQRIRQTDMTASSADYILFHSPYNKLVQKSFGRLLYHDMLSKKVDASPITPWLNKPIHTTYEDKDLETALKEVSKAGYKSKVSLGCEISQRIGNTYTASVYMNLAHLVSNLGNQLIGKKTMLFSYGSGALASIFSLVFRQPSPSTPFTLDRMSACLQTTQRLTNREQLTPNDLNTALQCREQLPGVLHCLPLRAGFAGYRPGKSICLHDTPSIETYRDTDVICLAWHLYYPSSVCARIVPSSDFDNDNVVRKSGCCTVWLSAFSCR